MDKEVKKFLKQCQNHPLVDRIEDRGVRSLVCPKDITKPKVTVHHTPSDWRWKKNAIRDLKKSGIEF